MDWLQFLQIVCVPAFVWLVYKFGEMRKELNDFKVQVAREMLRRCISTVLS